MALLDYKLDRLDPEWEGFFAFIEERLEIWRKKEHEKLPPPWTDDKVLAEGKFGNVFRQCDSGTKWETERMEWLRDKFKGYREEHWQSRQVQQILLYRHNLIPRTTDLLLNGAGPIKLADYDGPILHPCINEWPGIDMVAQCSSKLEIAKYAYKHHKDILANINNIYTWLRHGSLSALWVHQMLQDYLPCLGPFKAYEVITSLSYLDWCGFDGNSLLWVGHGAIDMFRRLTGMYSLDKAQAELLLPLIANQVQNALLVRDKVNIWPLPCSSKSFDCRALEDCMCEYRKYCAVLEGNRENRPYPDGLRRFEVDNM